MLMGLASSSTCVASDLRDAHLDAAGGVLLLPGVYRLPTASLLHGAGVSRVKFRSDRGPCWSQCASSKESRSR